MQGRRFFFVRRGPQGRGAALPCKHDSTTPGRGPALSAAGRRSQSEMTRVNPRGSTCRSGRACSKGWRVLPGQFGPFGHCPAVGIAVQGIVGRDDQGTPEDGSGKRPDARAGDFKAGSGYSHRIAWWSVPRRTARSRSSDTDSGTPRRHRRVAARVSSSSSANHARTRERNSCEPYPRQRRDGVGMCLLREEGCGRPGGSQQDP